MLVSFSLKKSSKLKTLETSGCCCCRWLRCPLELLYLLDLFIVDGTRVLLVDVLVIIKTTAVLFENFLKTVHNVHSLLTYTVSRFCHNFTKFTVRAFDHVVKRHFLILSSKMFLKYFEIFSIHQPSIFNPPRFI